MEMIKLGRREVSKELFIQAVADAHKVKDVAEVLGLNSSTVTTKEYIREVIIELGLDHSHIKNFDWRQTEEVLQQRIKKFSLTEDNQMYYDEFMCSLSEGSMATYKASCGNFLQSIGEQDYITVTKSQIIEYANGRNNMLAHLRSMMVYCINSDINGAVDKVDKQMLIWLISK